MKCLLKTVNYIFLLPVLISACSHSARTGADGIPPAFLGKFTDDYSIKYTITEKRFRQEPNVIYHIVKWNVKDKYIIAKNDADNPSEKGLYTRIDYMEFQNMAPFKWGFCFTVYDAASDKAAEEAAAADRSNPKKGCGGFPFSRMKRMP